MADRQTVEREDKTYILEPVKHKSQAVGFAPVPAVSDLDGMLGLYDDPETVFNLAYRQLKQDAKNAVRAKYNKDAISATHVVKAINNGTIKVDEVQAKMTADSLNFTEAACALMGIGQDAEIDATKIHWDIL